MNIHYASIDKLLSEAWAQGSQSSESLSTTTLLHKIVMASYILISIQFSFTCYNIFIIISSYIVHSDFEQRINWVRLH